MKKVIVTTTINPPTEAILAFDAMPDWTLVVVGDLKTPHDEYGSLRGEYLNPEDQERLCKPLSDALGWNCIQRRNMGFLRAHQLGADIVASVDDDNIPLPGWGQNLMVGKSTEMFFYDQGCVVFDPLWATDRPELWHRGFPLELLTYRQYACNRSRFTPDIQADFWNGDPDVDAICRFVINPRDVKFDSTRFPFSGHAPSPFNSQNTFLSRAVMPHYFMFPGIGRMDDIWAAYYVQSLGFKVAYGAPSVVQKRNPHSLNDDFEKELPGYRQSAGLITALSENPKNISSFIPEQSQEAFDIYQRFYESGD